MAWVDNKTDFMSDECVYIMPLGCVITWGWLIRTCVMPIFCKMCCFAWCAAHSVQGQGPYSILVRCFSAKYEREVEIGGACSLRLAACGLQLAACTMPSQRATVQHDVGRGRLTELCSWDLLPSVIQLLSVLAMPLDRIGCL